MDSKPKHKYSRVPLNRTLINEGQLRLLFLISRQHGVRPEEIINKIVKDYNEFYFDDYISSLSDRAKECLVFGPHKKMKEHEKRSMKFRVNMTDLIAQLIMADEGKFTFGNHKLKDNVDTPVDDSYTLEEVLNVIHRM